MMNLTLPKAILIGSFLIASAILFRVDGGSLVISQANAEVSGMNYRSLRRDRDFKKAVAYLVEECTVSGYVDDEYLYGGSISC